MDGETEFESTYLESIVSGWAVANGETPADEIVLDVDDDQAAHRTDDLERNELLRLGFEPVLKQFELTANQIESEQSFVIVFNMVQENTLSKAQSKLLKISLELY